MSYWQEHVPLSRLHVASTFRVTMCKINCAIFYEFPQNIHSCLQHWCEDKSVRKNLCCHRGFAKVAPQAPFDQTDGMNQGMLS